MFCGDGISDILRICDKYPDIYCHIVSGNCDRIDNFPLFKEFDMCGKHFYISHGHTECVKSGYMSLASRAMSFDSDIVLYGHTHIQLYDVFGDMHIMNPGSAYEGNYGVIDIFAELDEVKFSLKNIKEF